MRQARAVDAFGPASFFTCPQALKMRRTAAIWLPSPINSTRSPTCNGQLPSGFNKMSEPRSMLTTVAPVAVRNCS